MNKILIVEPEPTLLNLIAELLHLHGLMPITAASCEQGYELTKLEKPDVILCGHSSRYFNSYENCWKFITKLHQDSETADIPFIFMAGSDLETIPNWQNYVRYQDILLKPFNSEILLEKIYTYLPSSPKKSKTNQNHKPSDYRGFTNHNAFFTKENKTTHNYSYFLA